MKKYILIIIFFFSISFSFAQINAGTDDTICGGSATLTATLTSVSPINVTLSDDQFTGIINIGFPFTFYGNTYTQCLISSNNYVSFDLTNAGGYSPWAIPGPVPDAGNPLNTTMGPWQDINPGVGGTVRYALVGTSPNQIFVVEYCDVPMFSCTNLNFSSQIQLHENGNVVETHIINKPLCTGWNGGQAIHAMHNSTGTLADVNAGRNAPTQWTAALEGTRFTPNGINAYTIINIPFNPVVLGASGTINWTNLAGNPVGTGATVTVSPIVTTDYIASIQDLCSGATFRDTVRVVVNAPFNFSGSTTTITSCSGPTGTATVLVNGGSGNYSYQWDAAAANQTTSTATTLGVGTYTVTVTDFTLGCTKDTTFTIVDNNNMNVSIGSSQNITCNGANDGTASVNFSGGAGPYTFSWSPSGSTDSTATGLSPGMQTVTVTDSDGCQNGSAIIINEPNPVTVSFTNIADVLCFGGSTGEATAVATGGNGSTYNYNWSPTGQTSATGINLPADTYIVVATDSSGCTGSDSVTITEPATGLISTMSVNDVSCNGGTDGNATATPSGGTAPYSYSWTNGGGTAATSNNVGDGTYIVSITDTNGCSTTDTAIISEPTAMVLSLDSTDAICGMTDGTATVTATGGTGPYTYLWNAAAGNQTTSTATNIGSGNYSVTVTDDNGCASTGTVTVGQIDNMVAAMSANPSSGVYPLPVTFTNGSQNTNTYEWNFGDGNTATTSDLSSVSNNYIAPGVYTVTLIATNAGGCSDTAYLTINVLEESILIVPNVFSPNGDGINDEFITQYLYITEFECIVINRWGQEMFHTTNIDQGWNGKKQGGDECSEGTYYYVIKATGIDNKEYDLNGTVTLFRK